MYSKKPEMGISLSCIHCDVWCMVFKLYNVQMVKMKPFCVLNSSVVTTFHAAHTIYISAVLVLKSRKRIYLFGATNLRLFIHHNTHEAGASVQL
jgi:hypothetical protein